MRAWRHGTAFPIALVAVGQHAQSALDPAGPQGDRFIGLWWLSLAISVAVFVLVVIALLVAALRRRHEPVAVEPVVAPEPAGERSLGRVVNAAVAVTVVLLFVWLVASVRTGRAYTSLRAAGSARAPVEVTITGHQWWWEIEYPDTNPSLRVTTANELHVPVGRPVVLKMTSTDVIHSFWAPNLGGKRDLIPGHVTTMWFQADTPGVYRAQCAEFCGYQHAHMALMVVAEPAGRFRAWLAAQRQPAAPPTDSLRARGERVFLGADCTLCHSIAGTPAGGRQGPDLTHVGSRLTLAAGTLPNTRRNLAGWIVDPQSTKPGSLMPQNPLGSEDLQALISYLEGLR
ncbi:MAG TPA: cytochrome c oxidase subunit II [Gemmatimonadaceae bacterium]